MSLAAWETMPAGSGLTMRWVRRAILALTAFLVPLVPGAPLMAAAWQAQNTETLKQVVEPYRKKIALIVGIDHYENGIPALSYAAADALAVKQVLEDKFGFDVRMLLDRQAKKESIINEIIRLHDEMTREDQLLFFFAGHGVSFGEGNEEIGYLLPHDARGSDQKMAWNSGIPMSEIVAHLVKLPPKHILILLDTCFSGYAAMTPRGSAERNPDDLLRRLTSLPARQLFSAGMKGQPAYESQEWEHSAFVVELLKGLGEGKADRNRDDLITISELYSYMKPAVTYLTRGAQTPYLATLDQSQGEFVFIQKPRWIPALTKEGVRRKALIAGSDIPLFQSAYARIGREAPFLQTYFLFEGEKNHRVPAATKAKADQPEGWIEKANFIEWNSLEVALVVEPEGKPIVPVFAAPDCAVKYAAEANESSCNSQPLAPEPTALIIIPLLERSGDAYRGVPIPVRTDYHSGQRQILGPLERDAGAEASPQSKPSFPSGWLPRKNGRQILMQESVFMLRDDARRLTNLIENISIAAKRGSIEGSEFFLQMANTAFSQIIGQEITVDEQLDRLLTKSSFLPFRTMSLSFTLREVQQWKPDEFEQLNRQLERKVEALREFIQDPKQAYRLNEGIHVFIPRDLFP